MREPRLDPRLQAVAGEVIKGTVALDLGTDHASLPAWLVWVDWCPRAIATDVCPRPLHQARRNLQRLELLDKVELRLGDGLSVLAPPDAVGTIVCAGLGGSAIIRALARGSTRPMHDVCERVVLAPQQETPRVRAFLHALGWRITAERLVEHAGRFYPVLAAAPMPQSARSAACAALDVGVDPRRSGASAGEWTTTSLSSPPSEETLDFVGGPLLRHARPEPWRRWLIAELARVEQCAARLGARGGWARHVTATHHYLHALRQLARTL